MDEDILKLEQAKIQSLQEQIKNLTQPSKTISHQIKYMKYGNRNCASKRLINKRNKLKLNNRIAESRRIILGLDKSVLAI